MIETERLRLRPITREDRDALIEIYRDPDVAQFMTPFGPDNADERLLAYEQGWRERRYGVMAIIDRATGVLLGRSGLHYWPQFDETEVGWLLRRDAWGRGYAAEAARACLAWGFRELGLREITAMIDPRNARSVAVAERLGMKPLREDTLLGFHVVVHAITADAWEADSGRGRAAPAGAPGQFPPHARASRAP